MATQRKDHLSDEEFLVSFTDAVWRQMGGNDSPCPPEKAPTFRQLDDLISATAWDAQAREEFFRRRVIVEKISDKSFNDVGSFAHLV